VNSLAGKKVIKRPTGITILAVLGALGGALLLLSSLVFGTLAAGSLPSYIRLPPLILGSLSIIIAIVGMFSLVAAYGLWKGIVWSWWLTILVSIINIVMSVVNIIDFIIAFAVGAIIIYYLNRENVKSFFGFKD
jgi:lysylphosphatidylglycerol synthetase-like protein (DUF2156 family)